MKKMSVTYTVTPPTHWVDVLLLAQSNQEKEERMGLTFGQICIPTGGHFHSSLRLIHHQTGRFAIFLITEI